MTQERSSEAVEYSQTTSLRVGDFNQINPLETNTVYFGVTETGECVHAGMVDDRMLERGYRPLIVAFCSSSVLIQEPSVDFPIGRSQRLCANCFRRTSYTIAERIRTFVRDGKNVEGELLTLVEQVKAGMGDAQIVSSLQEIVARERVRNEVLLTFEKFKDRPAPVSDKLIEKL